MSAEQSKSGDSVTLGVGGPTSGEQGATLTHETMAETGGSGGDQQTKPRNEEVAGATRGASQSAQPGSTQGGSQCGNQEGEASTQPEGAGTAATAVGRGPQDTRSHQAGILPTGLGTPETGGNQSEEDLAPPRKD
jgi:hypothetical protein